MEEDEILKYSMQIAMLKQLLIKKLINEKEYEKYTVFNREERYKTEILSLVELKSSWIVFTQKNLMDNYKIFYLSYLRCNLNDD